MEVWFCYCLYLEVECGWNHICQDPFLRFRITVNRETVLDLEASKAAVITFWGLVWWEKDAEIRGVPGYLHSPTYTVPQLAWRQELSTESPSGICLFLFQAPSCFSASADCLWSSSFPFGEDCLSHCFTHSYNRSLFLWYSVLLSWWSPDYSIHTPSYVQELCLISLIFLFY